MSLGTFPEKDGKERNEREAPIIKVTICQKKRERNKKK